MVPAEQSLSNKLYLIPVSGRPIFPGIFTPLMITANDDARVAEEAYSGDGLIGIVMLKNDGDAPTAQDLHNVGTVARIIKKINLPDGGVNIFISTIKRFRIRKVLSQREPMVAVVEYLADQADRGRKGPHSCPHQRDEGDFRQQSLVLRGNAAEHGEH